MSTEKCSITTRNFPFEANGDGGEQDGVIKECAMVSWMEVCNCIVGLDP